MGLGRTIAKVNLGKGKFKVSVETTWEHYFKPEVRKQGREDLAEGLAVMSVAGDARIEGYVKASKSIKVLFVADSIGSNTFAVDCSCSSASKGTFCRHIWAMLLLTEKKHPDFLDSKTNLEKGTLFVAVESPFKAKQADYKKQQYQKLKERAKEQRQQIKNKAKGISSKSAKGTTYSQDVNAAFEFFSVNGFPLENNLDEESLKNAKKVLARVFHPDKGGTHDESVILNENYQILMDYLA
ncbi:J domain-containing protein [Bdellovibrio sp. KM01]|uniref:J domain-containing protein n=1 Tax=Bdellovibrio sp. KM01 TaxID=2748865 RepID=UPI0015E9F54A|nr:J domain-containing protein [Bdellovibrio sp. KM01]QLY24176.1 J domain-containing protein [Bdellovibrio sp. KM01]